MSTRSHQHDVAVSGSALDALLQVESDVAERVARARADAAVVIADATTAAAELTQRAHAALDRELAERDVAQGQAVAMIARDVAQAAADLVRRYHHVTSDETARMAAVVLAEVTGLAMADRTGPTRP
jgi:vacuolar-type H+-ATPase subunit H